MCFKIQPHVLETEELFSSTISIFPDVCESIRIS
jgi:hypothetical protein